MAPRFRAVFAFLLSLAGCRAVAGPVDIDARFGRVEIDTTRPALTALTLRRADGTLEPRSILAPIGGAWPRGVANWAEGGYTYVVDDAGKRYESRNAPPHAVRHTSNKVVVEGVLLCSAPGASPVAVERWTLSAATGALSWTVERRWLRGFVARLVGTPGLFSSFRRSTDTELLPNSTTHTLWVRPDGLRSRFEPLYRAWPADYKLSLDNCVVVNERDTWAIAKLWTSWHAQSDPRFAVKGGHLYRRGFFGWRSELGAVSSPDLPRRYRAGEMERVTLTVDTVDKRSTGYQLAVSIPDHTVQSTLASFYGSLLNGGAVNDQKHFDFGNETDGWYYDGSTWMQGLALSAGVPGPGRLASRPFTVASAFRDHLAAIVGTVNSEGVGNFGYDWGGGFADARLNNAIGAREYLVHTGDLAFIAQILPDLERGVGWFLRRRNAQGLADLGAVAHWYYDAMPSSGVNANHNALLFRACQCMAEMERAAGHAGRAETYLRIASEVKAAFNRVLWNEDAPDGPRLTDWVAQSGEKVTYAADVCQFPAVAFGMLSRERARKLLATLDRRSAELALRYGYTDEASLSAYWPVPDHINTLEWQRAFPIYMNGGSFLAITYYEIMARIEAGDVDGAWERMRRFSEAIGRHSGAGNNWVTIKGEAAAGADEPYLSDMVVVPAALVRGFLGIDPTWERLVVRPHLPRGWRRASAEILYKGVRHRIVIDGERVTIAKLRREYTPAAELTWEVRQAPPTEWQMTVSRHWANGAVAPTVSHTIELDGGRHVVLRRERPTRGLLGRWTMERAPDAGAEGPVVFGQPGPGAGCPSATFAGQSHLSVPGPAWFDFSPRQSFTLQCWFRTDARDSRVMVSRPDAYCLYVKEGRLAAWLMQTDHQYREALGGAIVADGEWHHAAAVYDRASQRLSLYVDGRLDTPNGEVTATNPVSISGIGASTSSAPLSIGGLGSGFRFVGSLADVRVHAGALAPADLSCRSGGDERVSSAQLAPTGSYVTTPCDWGQEATLKTAIIDCSLHGGSVFATIEQSSDAFRTVAHGRTLRLRDGADTLSVAGGPYRYARVRLDLRASPDRIHTPEVRYLRLSAVPAPGSPVRQSR
jgi:hypothetical protein